MPLLFTFLEEEAARKWEDAQTSCLDWNGKRGGREGDARSREEMQLNNCTHSKCSRWLESGGEDYGGERKSGGERYKRETIMGLAQINIAQ
jgi:hypothetical protein